MIINGAKIEKGYNQVDFLAGMDFRDRYMPELAMLPFKKNVLRGKSIEAKKTWMEAIFPDYLAGDGVDFKELPAESVWNNTYERVDFQAKELRVVIPTYAHEIICNEDYYALGTYSQKYEASKLELFRNRAWDYYHEILDKAMYKGCVFNDASTTASFQSFKSVSTNPSDVGLPTDVQDGSALDLVNLMESAISFLKNNGTKRTTESQIHFIIGSKIFRQSYAIVGMQSFGMPTMQEIFASKFQGTGITYTVSQMLEDDMIISDKTMIETVSGQGFSLLPGMGKQYSDEYDRYKTSSGLASVFLGDKLKSLYYSYVLGTPPLKIASGQRTTTPKKEITAPVATANRPNTTKPVVPSLKIQGLDVREISPSTDTPDTASKI